MTELRPKALGQIIKCNGIIFYLKLRLVFGSKSESTNLGFVEDVSDFLVYVYPASPLTWLHQVRPLRGASLASR